MKQDLIQMQVFIEHLKNIQVNRQKNTKQNNLSHFFEKQKDEIFTFKFFIFFVKIFKTKYYETKNQIIITLTII